MNKPVHLGFSILELSRILMYEFWYDYVKTKYGEKSKLCYMDRVSLHTLKQMIFTEILKKMFETRFDNSKYELDKPMPKGKNKKK